LAERPPFELEARRLSPEDLAFLEQFDAGDSWWCGEVTAHLRNFALAQQTAGYNETTLFSNPRDGRIVGFATVSSDRLRIPQVQAAFPEFGVAPGIVTTFVPAWIIPYFGVNRDAQGRTFGEEMHASTLVKMEQSHGSPRFIYLQCWEENEGAVRFWRRLGYREFHHTTPQRPDGNGQAALIWMLYDRQHT
jgi:ribosomal protein S18 acetylase RimI-like enzyme